LALNEKQSSITDAVSSFFEELSDWGRIALGWITHSKRSSRLGKLAIVVAITDQEGNFTASPSTLRTYP